MQLARGPGKFEQAIRYELSHAGILTAIDGQLPSRATCRANNQLHPLATPLSVRSHARLLVYPPASPDFGLPYNVANVSSLSIDAHHPSLAFQLTYSSRHCANLHCDTGWRVKSKGFGSTFAKTPHLHEPVKLPAAFSGCLNSHSPILFLFRPSLRQTHPKHQTMNQQGLFVFTEHSNGYR